MGGVILIRKPWEPKMIVPDKKSIRQIEEEIERLHESHTRSINDWMKARLEQPNREKVQASKEGSCAFSNE